MNIKVTSRDQVLLDSVIPKMFAVVCAQKVKASFNHVLGYFLDRHYIKQAVKAKISTRGADLDTRIDKLVQILYEQGYIEGSIGPRSSNSFKVVEKKFLEEAPKYAVAPKFLSKDYKQLHESRDPNELIYVWLHKDDFLFRETGYGILEVLPKTDERTYNIGEIRLLIDHQIKDHWVDLLNEMGRKDVVKALRKHAVQKFLESIPKHINDRSIDNSFVEERSPKFLLAHADLIDYDVLYKNETA